MIQFLIGLSIGLFVALLVVGRDLTILAQVIDIQSSHIKTLAKEYTNQSQEIISFLSEHVLDKDESVIDIIPVDKTVN